MGNYTIFYVFENHRRGQASKKFYNKCSENSRSQIVFRTDIFGKLALGAPEYSFAIDRENVNFALFFPQFLFQGNKLTAL